MKHQLLRSQKILHGIMLLSVFLSAFGGKSPYPVYAQAVTSEMPVSKIQDPYINKTGGNNNINSDKDETIAAQVSSDHTITYFRGNKPGAISFTFDDGYPSQSSTVVSMLNARGLKGTFFVVTDWAEHPFNDGTGWASWADWQNIVTQGHEVASHTVTHPSNLTTLTPGEMLSEVANSQYAIGLNLPGQACASLSYPQTASDPNVRAVAAEYYFAARGGYMSDPGWQNDAGWVNTYQSGQDQYGTYAAVDFYNIGSKSADGLDYNEPDFNGYLARAVLRHGWMNLHYHVISDTAPTNAVAFGNMLDYIQGSNNYWIDTFCNVGRYMKERMNSTVELVSQTTYQIRLNIAMNALPPTATYDFPLTIRSVVPTSWTQVIVQQGAATQNPTPAMEGSEKVVYYDAIPNGGEIVLKTPYPVPGITSLNPSSTIAGGSSFTLTVNGNNLANESVVRWNGADRATTYVNSTKLTATILSSDIGAGGTASVTVFTPTPGGGTSGPLTLTINLPPPPTAFTKTSPADGATDQALSLTLHWAASTGAASYEYCYDTTDDNACTSWVSNGTLTSKALSGLTTATTYYWQVRAVNLGGSTYADGSSTAFRTFTTVPNPPGAFGKTSPSDEATNQLTSVTLNWAASAGAASYDYCYDISNDNACSSWASNGASTNKTLNSLTPGLTYYWHVRAINSGGYTYSNNSSIAFWKFTLSCYTLTKNVSPVEGGAINTSPAPNCNSGTQYAYGTVVTLTAAANTGYNLANWSGDVSGSVNSIDVTMAANKSVTATFASFNNKLSAPTLRSPQNNLLTRIASPTFLWSNVPGAQSYEIMFASDSVFANILDSKRISALSYVPASALGQGKYYWRMRVYNTSNEFGKWSAIRSFTIDSIGPAVPVLSSPANGAPVTRTPTFKWLSVPTAVSYKFQYNNSSNFTNPMYSAATRSTYRRPPAMKAGNYYWRVCAQDAAGNWGFCSAPNQVTIPSP